MRALLEQLTVEDPKRPEPYAALGYLAWRGKEIDEAVKDFGKACELGDREPKLLWDYARLARGRNNPEEIRALTALVALTPERLGVRMDLVEVFLISKKADAALAVLMPVTQVTKEEAPRFFAIKAHAQLDDGLFDDARKSAQNLARFAKTDEQKSQAAQIAKYLDERASGTVAAPSFAEGLESAERKAMQGLFAELDCSGMPAKLIVETAEGRKLLLIDCPYRILGGGPR